MMESRDHDVYRIERSNGAVHSDSGEVKDHYFSQRLFDKVLGTVSIGEVKIDGEWKLFTEQITVGHTPMTSRYEDLVYLGRSAERRYSSANGSSERARRIEEAINF